MSRIKHAIIMAAGRGQRMMPLTDSIPKPMAPYGGTTLIANGIDCIRDRISHIHITVGYKKAMLAQHVIEHGACSVFNTEGKGNSWWIYNTLLKHLNEPMYVLTSDNVVELDFDLLEESYLSLGAPACALVPVKPVAGLEGDYIFHENGVVTELSREKPTAIYCSGIQILNPAKINNLTAPDEDFYGVWRQLMSRGQLMTSSIYPKQWISIDTMEQLAAVNLSFASRQ